MNYAKYLNVLFTVICGLWCCVSFGQSTDFDYVELGRIELSCDTILSEIVKLALSKDIQLGKSEQDSLYSLSINELNGGWLVRIVKEKGSFKFPHKDCYGYAKEDENIIVISGNANPHLKFREPSENRRFKLRSSIDGPYDPIEAYYFVILGSYAKFVPGIGWIWYKLPPTIENNNPSILTIPKRRFL